MKRTTSLLKMIGFTESEKLNVVQLTQHRYNTRIPIRIQVRIDSFEGSQVKGKS